MAATENSFMPRIGILCRTAAVTLIAAVSPGRSIGDVNDSVVAQPARKQALITLVVFAALFLLNLAAAQFGWIGILLLWLGIIVLVN